MSDLDIVSVKRGAWNVVTVPGGFRVTPYSLPNKKAVQAARDAIAAGIPDFPWGVCKDGLRDAVSAFAERRGMSLADAVMRALAAVPAADPHGFCAHQVKQQEIIRAEQAAYAAREDAGGYTETVKPYDIVTGDEISFRYTVLPRRAHFFPGLKLERDKVRTVPRSVTVRGTVTGEGRVMDGHGNNHGESVDGLRFPLDGATWLDDDGGTGPVPYPVTVDWLARVRRRPRKG